MSETSNEASYPDDVPAVAFTDMGGCSYVRGRDFHMVIGKLIKRDSLLVDSDSMITALLRDRLGLQTRIAELEDEVEELRSELIDARERE